MKNFADCITLDYGNANISFFNIHIEGEKQVSSDVHKHIYYELHFSFDLTLSCSVNGKTLEIPKNSLFIIPPGTDHTSIYPAKDVEKKHIVLALSIKKTQKGGDFYSSLISALNKKALTPISFNEISKNELLLFEDRELYHSLLGVCRLKAVASELIFKTLTALLSKENCEVEGEKDIYVLIDNMIQYRDFTLDEIARETNYSKRHISRIIKNRYGMSLSKLRQKQNK